LRFGGGISAAEIFACSFVPMTPVARRDRVLFRTVTEG
jgi:hypothetical protein